MLPFLRVEVPCQMVRDVLFPAEIEMVGPADDINPASTVHVLQNALQIVDGTELIPIATDDQATSVLHPGEIEGNKVDGW